jgi:hypothetical protein
MKISSHESRKLLSNLFNRLAVNLLSAAILGFLIGETVNLTGQPSESISIRFGPCYFIGLCALALLAFSLSLLAFPNKIRDSASADHGEAS